jgi:hypothetical protein
MRLTIVLDLETSARLAEAAVIENRPMNMQAEILVRRAVGLPDPRPDWAPLITQAEPVLAPA